MWSAYPLAQKGQFRNSVTKILHLTTKTCPSQRRALGEGAMLNTLVRLSYIKKMRGTKQQNSAVQPTTAIVAGKGGQERKPDELSFGP